MGLAYPRLQALVRESCLGISKRRTDSARNRAGKRNSRGASTEMIKAILGRKLGMTQVFEAGGIATGVTVIEAGPCVVTQVKTPERDGYTGVQLGWGEVRGAQADQAERGHLRKKKLPLVRHLREVRVDSSEDGHKRGRRASM